MKVRRKPFKCQFTSRVVDGTGITKRNLLHICNVHMRLNTIDEFEINNLPSILKNQREAGSVKRLTPENTGRTKIQPARAWT